MHRFINSFFSKDLTALLTFLFFGCVCGAVLRWEYVWWDVLNYHYYNPWAFLNDRMDVDVVPAGVNTFFSPFIDFPFYFLINALNKHPVIFSAVMSVPYGLLLFAAYKISTLFFLRDTEQGRLRIRLSVLLFICSEQVLFQISSASHEHLLSLLVLTAFYPLLKGLKAHKCTPSVLLFSGFLLGATAGLKLTYAAYAAATGITLIVFAKQTEKPVKSILLFTFAGICGFLIAYGYWGWVLWKHYGNPFFPFFNDIFHSPYWQAPSYKDSRYFNKSWGEVIFFPFFWYIGELKGDPYTPSLLRYPIGAVLSGIAVFQFLKAKQNGRKPEESDLFYLLMFWLGTSYIIWLALYRLPRYLIPVELLLSIVLISLILKKDLISLKSVRLFFILLFSLSVICTIEHRIYKRPANASLLPKLAPLPNDTLLVFVHFPGSLLIPFLAPNETVPVVVKNPRYYNGSRVQMMEYFIKKQDDLFQNYLKRNRPIVYLTYKILGWGTMCSDISLYLLNYRLCWDIDHFFYAPGVPIRIWF